MLDPPTIVKSPEQLAAYSINHGPYEKLGEASEELMSWILANGFKTRADLWERYLAGPDSNPDPSTFRTELNRPLEY